MLSSTAPSWIVVKRRDSSANWAVGHSGLGAWNKLEKQWPMYASSIVFEVLRCSDTKRRYVRAFYSNGSNEDSENDDIGMQEVVFGDSSGAHLLGEETQLMPFETFEKFCNFVSLDQS